MPISSSDDPAPWRESNVLINCLSIAMVGGLVPRAPLSGAQIYLTLATFAFAALALLNHMFPRRLHRLTHGVKAAYTHLVFASVGPSMLFLGARWWVVPVLISAVDLIPAVVEQRWLRSAAEGLGATARWGAIGFGFHLVRFPWWLVLVYASFTAAYGYERRRRIASGRRHEYGWLHCMEHLAVWLYLLVVNWTRLDLPLVIGLHAGALLTIAGLLVALGVTTNLRIYRSIERHLPAWFDPALHGLILSKSRSNAFSHRLQHYVIKPFSPKMVNRRVSWSEIESMVHSIEVRGQFDAVVGVTSGGAFIARCVASRLGIETVHYAHSRLWSRLALHQNVVRSFRYYAGLPNPTAPRFFGEDVDLTGKRVLVVDDSVCTGATLASVKEMCLQRGAREVETLALFSNPDHPTDYHHQLSKTPLVWPWGWESD